MNKIRQWISDYRIILFLFVVTSIVASAQSLLLGTKTYVEGGREYNRYNNYTIFKQSFYHLIDKKDLYILYPVEHWDLYKYSPTFSMLFGIFGILPDSIGLMLWNALNAVILVFAIYYLPKFTLQQKGLILLACVFESMTAMQNEQSNGLMAGLIILAFGLCERQKYFIAALCLVLSVYIKIFSVVGFALFLFYPQKWKLTLYTFFWALVLLLIPLFVIDFDQLKSIYESWIYLLRHDHTPSAYGFSVLGWLKTWFHFHGNNLNVILTGALIFLLPFGRLKMYTSYDFRILALASILIWIVIFNHMAESPTFVIALAGVSIWFFTRRPTLVNIILFLLAMILTSLSSTDLFPNDFRNEVIRSYVLKAFPCILIWIKIIVDMMFAHKEIESPDGLQPSRPDTG